MRKLLYLLAPLFILMSQDYQGDHSELYDAEGFAASQGLLEFRNSGMELFGVRIGDYLNSDLFHSKYIVVFFAFLLVVLLFPTSQTTHSDKQIPNSIDLSFKQQENQDQGKGRLKLTQYDDLLSHPLVQQHIHPIRKMIVPTVGVPIPGNYFNFTQVCPTDFRTYEKQLDSLFKPHNETDCQQAIFGNHSDQAYILCKNFMKNSKALLNLGLEGKDSFGCHITQNYGIFNFLYDKDKVYEKSYCKSNRLTVFQQQNFGQEIENIEGHQFTTLQKEITSRGLKDKHFILKMDTEGTEWSALRYLPLKYLKNIDQMVFQVHLPDDLDKTVSYWGTTDIIKSLKQHFVCVNLHMNNFGRIDIRKIRRQYRWYPTTAFEVTLVNKRLLTVYSESRNYRQKVKNFKNNDDREDLDMIQWQK